MDTDGDLASAVQRHDRSNLCKLQRLLCFSHCKYLLLPFVVRLLTDTVFFAPSLYTQSAVSARRDPLCPQGQLLLPIQLLQFCTHNKNTPVPRIVHESRVYYPLLYESIVSLYLAALKSPLALTVTVADASERVWGVASSSPERLYLFRKSPPPRMGAGLRLRSR